MAMLEVNNLKKIYTARFGGSSVQALSKVCFSVEKGEYVAIMGAVSYTHLDVYKRQYMSGSMRTPRSVPIKRQPKGFMPKRQMPRERMSLPRGGWDIS